MTSKDSWVSGKQVLKDRWVPTVFKLNNGIPRKPAFRCVVFFYFHFFHQKETFIPSYSLSKLVEISGGWIRETERKLPVAFSFVSPSATDTNVSASLSFSPHFFQVRLFVQSILALCVEGKKSSLGNPFWGNGATKTKTKDKSRRNKPNHWQKFPQRGKKAKLLLKSNLLNVCLVVGGQLIEFLARRKASLSNWKSAVCSNEQPCRLICQGELKAPSKWSRTFSLEVIERLGASMWAKGLEPKTELRAWDSSGEII